MCVSVKSRLNTALDKLCKLGRFETAELIKGDGLKIVYLRANGLTALLVKDLETVNECHGHDRALGFQRTAH